MQPEVMSRAHNNSEPSFSCIVPALRIGILEISIHYRLVMVRNEGLLRHRWPDIPSSILPIWELNWLRSKVLVFNHREKVTDAIQVRMSLDIGVNHEPWGLLGVRMSEHHVLRLGVVFPTG